MIAMLVLSSLFHFLVVFPGNYSDLSLQENEVIFKATMTDTATPVVPVTPGQEVNSFQNKFAIFGKQELILSSAPIYVAQQKKPQDKFLRPAEANCSSVSGDRSRVSPPFAFQKGLWHLKLHDLHHS